jgi:hypothetical protein
MTIVGNSAGACHVATYLYRDAVPNFEESLAPLVTDPTNQPGKEQVRPTAAMLIGMPAHFRLAGPERAPVTYGYHCPELFSSGAEDTEMRRAVEDRCPIGLRRRSADRTRVGVMLAELDPEPEIAGPVGPLPLLVLPFAVLIVPGAVEGVYQTSSRGHGHASAGTVRQGA